MPLVLYHLFFNILVDIFLLISYLNSIISAKSIMNTSKTNIMAPLILKNEKEPEIVQKILINIFESTTFAADMYHFRPKKKKILKQNIFEKKCERKSKDCLKDVLTYTSHYNISLWRIFNMKSDRITPFYTQ